VSCQKCDAKATNTAWSSNTGKACTDNFSCTANELCNSNFQCVGSPADVHEPNGTSGTAKYLGNTKDTTKFPKGAIQGYLFGTDKTDWYKYTVEDKVGGNVEPKVVLSQIPNGSNYDLCAYFTCDSTTKGVTCETGSSATYGGLKGCCSTKSSNSKETVKLNVNCSGWDDGGTVHVRVTRISGGNTCDKYWMDWGDD